MSGTLRLIGSVAFLVAPSGLRRDNRVKSHLFHERTRSWLNILKARFEHRHRNPSIADAFTEHVPSPNRADQIGSLFGNLSKAQAGSSTRNCARMTTFLIAGSWTRR